jgi:hypothetical protein
MAQFKKNKKMVKYIKRTTDNKFLQSLENDSWVENIKDAYDMTYRECESAKTELLNSYSVEQIVEIPNMVKSKPLSKEERKELIDLLKR